MRGASNCFTCDLSFSRSVLIKLEEFLTPVVASFRYFELEAVHGKLDRLAEVDMSVCTQLDLQLDILFQGRKERLEVNTQQQVRDLLKTISNIVGLPASKLRVFHQMIFQGQVIDTSLMSVFPKKNLWTYNMSPEDIIICDHKDTSGMTNAIVSFAGEGKLERD